MTHNVEPDLFPAELKELSDPLMMRNSSKIPLLSCKPGKQRSKDILWGELRIKFSLTGSLSVHMFECMFIIRNIAGSMTASTQHLLLQNSEQIFLTSIIYNSLHPPALVCSVICCPSLLLHFELKLWPWGYRKCFYTLIQAWIWFVKSPDPLPHPFLY